MEEFDLSHLTTLFSDENLHQKRNAHDRVESGDQVLRVSLYIGFESLTKVEKIFDLVNGQDPVKHTAVNSSEASRSRLSPLHQIYRYNLFLPFNFYLFYDLKTNYIFTFAIFVLQSIFHFKFC